MKIAHIARTVAPLHKPGGLETAVAELSRELAALGHDVHIFARPPDADRRDLLTARTWGDGVIYHPISYPDFGLRWGLKRDGVADRLLNYTRWTLGLQRAVASVGGFDGIYAQGVTAAAFGQPTPPLVFNPQGLEEFKASGAKHAALWPLRLLLLRAARHARATVATDRALVPDIRRYLHLPDDKIAVIPNAVNLAAIDNLSGDKRTQTAIADWRAQLVNAGVVLLSVGRIEPNKGLNVLADALAQLPKDLAWRWIVAGEGSARPALAAQVARHGLSERVTFAGRVDDPTLHALYEVADIYVHPTLYEGSSLVTLEAQAHRKPVIASETGGLPDKVLDVRRDPDSATGLLARPGDASDLAAALIFALRELSPDKRRALGEVGRARVERLFTWSAAARATAALFDRLNKRS